MHGDGSGDGRSAFGVFVFASGFAAGAFARAAVGGGLAHGKLITSSVIIESTRTILFGYPLVKFPLGAAHISRAFDKLLKRTPDLCHFPLVNRSTKYSFILRVFPSVVGLLISGAGSSRRGCPLG